MTTLSVGSRVFDVADPRHTGIIKSICHRTGGDIATIRWEETGWLSVAVPTKHLRIAEIQLDNHPSYSSRFNSSPINILQAAIECDSDDAAALLIQDALGITDGGVAGYCFPKNWPDNPHQRALVIADWLATELRFLA